MNSGRRERFYDAAAQFTEYASVDAMGATYLVRTEDRNVGRRLFVHRVRTEMNVLAGAVRLITTVAGEDAIVGREFIDVGANIGTSTIPALLAHRFGSALCFEPEPRNLLTLRLNLLLNGLEGRAKTIGAAVSDSSGTADLIADSTQGGKGWIATGERTRKRKKGGAAIPVRTVTLDRMVAEGLMDPENAGILWIDVQGHEGHVLEGATGLLERGVPIVLEWYPPELDKIGKRAPIEDAFAVHYTHFVDLRPNPASGRPDYELRPAATLGECMHLSAEADRPRVTDVLALRLEHSLAESIDPAEILAGSGLGPESRRQRLPAAIASRFHRGHADSAQD